MRILWVDYAKAVIIPFVVFVHVGSGIILSRPPDSLDWWIINIIDACGRSIFPMFIMISGYFALDPSIVGSESLRVYYGKRFRRIFLPLIFWVAFYTGWVALRGIIQNNPVPWMVLIQRLLVGAPYYHIWYMFMLAGLYLVTPILRFLLIRLSYKVSILFCAACFLLAALYAFLNDFYWHYENWFFSIFLHYLGYFLAGYLIDRVNMKGRYFWVALFLVLCTTVTGYGYYYYFKMAAFQKAAYFHNLLSVPIILSNLVVYAWIRNHEWPVDRLGIFKNFSNQTLGIYLLHPIFVDLFNYIGVGALEYPAIISLPINGVTIILLCYYTSILLRRIPVFSRLV